MFAPIDPVSGLLLAQTAGEESSAAVLAMEGNNPDQCSHMLSRRLRTRTQRAFLPTTWAGHLAAHSGLVSSAGNRVRPMTAL